MILLVVYLKDKEYTVNRFLNNLESTPLYLYTVK